MNPEHRTQNEKRQTLFCLPILILLLFITACSPYPREVERSLKMSGENRSELEQVLKHYREDPNPEKLQAAYFLLAHMKDMYWLDGDIITAYDTLFTIIDSMYAQKLPVAYMGEYIQKQWDSIATINGLPIPSQATVYPELTNLKAATLRAHIDQAFRMRDSVPWGKDVPFEDFCEYILPHRIGNELPEDWRTHLYHKTMALRDTTKAKDRRALADQLNRFVKRYMGHNNTFWSYSIDLPPSKLEKSRMGSCKHTVFYIAMMLRAHGIPVGIDYTPLWAGAKTGHEWNVLLCEDGTFHPFDAISNNFTMPLTDRKIAKVFRVTFTAQTKGLHPRTEEIPTQFYNTHAKDVTQEYVKTFDVRVKLNQKTENKYALICTFNNKEWAPQYWGRIRWGKVMFRNMGAGIAYRVMAYRGGELTGLSDPFILDTLGNIRPLTPQAERRTVRLERKYLLTTFMKGLMAKVVNRPFHGANRADFSDSVRLFTIRKTPLNMTDAPILETKKFRYARYYGSHMAEVEFYGLAPNGRDTLRLQGKIIGNPEQDPKIKTPYSVMFDGDLSNYFVAPRAVGEWGGMDFGKPVQIVKIRYCPRSDTNFIIPGHEYELCYWQDGTWKSMGKKLAKDQYIEFANVPSGALYVLHNHTKGNEERIFTIENGKQVFW